MSKQKPSTLLIGHNWSIFNNKDFENIKIQYESFYKNIFKNFKTNIIILQSVPEFSNGISMEKCSEFPKYIIKKRYCDYASIESFKIKKNKNNNLIMRKELVKSQKGTIYFLNPYDYLCDERNCKQVIDGYDVYDDADHLSIKSSFFLIEKWEKELNKVF